MAKYEEQEYITPGTFYSGAHQEVCFIRCTDPYSSPDMFLAFPPEPDDYKAKRRQFVTLEHGVLKYDAGPRKGVDTRIDKRVFLPETCRCDYGGWDAEQNYSSEITIEAFGFEMHELEHLIEIYDNINCAQYGVRGRITFSKKDNSCDLTGATIPNNFPYITFAESPHLYSHVSLYGFYSMLRFITRSKTPIKKAFLKAGADPELITRLHGLRLYGDIY